MARRYFDLPSLTGLQAFEAAARLSSLKLATTELNVTSGAISRQIKALETELGVPLFIRTGRGMRLTPEGAELYNTVAAGFSRIADVAREIKRGDQSRNVTIATTDTTGSMWLVPRMPEFWRRHPDVTIDHQLAENIRNFRPEEVQIRIRHGVGDWTNSVKELLFDEWIYPVCSPDFAARHAGATVADLPKLPLLDIDWVAPDWITWEQALLQGGVSNRSFRARRLGKFSLAMQAAAADQGVALAWHRMVGPMLERGELVRLTDFVFRAPGTYYLTWDRAQQLSVAAELLRGWIHEQAAVEKARPLPVCGLPPARLNQI